MDKEIIWLSVQYYFHKSVLSVFYLAAFVCLCLAGYLYYLVEFNREVIPEPTHFDYISSIATSALACTLAIFARISQATTHKIEHNINQRRRASPDRSDRQIPITNVTTPPGNSSITQNLLKLIGYDRDDKGDTIFLFIILSVIVSVCLFVFLPIIF